MSRVAVVGSLNCDLVVRASRRPGVGETILGNGFDMFVGGKGNNQAIAAARAGAQVSMIGRVGKDPFSPMILEKLAASHVDATHVKLDAEAGTGIADILVEPNGDNSIVVVPRANGRTSAADVEEAKAAITSARVLLLQLEIPIETVTAAAKLARAAGVFVVLNPAPAPDDGKLPDELVAAVDLLVVNESEAQALSTGRVTETPAREMARSLAERGLPHVVLTLGSQGAFHVDPARASTEVPAFEVEVVDTTAAGDAFCGALAALLAQSAQPNADVARAVVYGCAAGALACTRLGAEPSLPARDAIEALVSTRDH